MKTTVLLTICAALLIPASAAACAACTSVQNPECGAAWNTSTHLCTVGCYTSDPVSEPGETFTCTTSTFQECLSAALLIVQCPQAPEPDDGTGGLDQCDPNTSHP